MDKDQINFTPKAQKIVKDAKQEAAFLNTKSADLEHLFLAFLKVENSIINDIFEEAGVDKNELRDLIVIEFNNNSRPTKPNEKILYSVNIKNVLTSGRKLALKLNHSYVSCEHLFYSFLKNKHCPAISFFEALNIQLPEVLDKLEKFFDIDESEQEESEEPESNERVQALASFAVNCNIIAAEQGYDPMIGREKEVEELAEILCRRGKNNPILLGEAGVGKTALVEALAQKIVTREAPEFLLSKQIFSLDLGSLIAGTKYRGQFEERLKKIIEELSINEDFIIFIDEIHTLIGAGGAEGTMDAANMLKPLLARGKVRCIGATTISEYRKTIAKDGGLDRRFEKLHISEPTKSDAIKILEGLKLKYQEFHNVIYQDHHFELAVQLSSRYITDRYLPDKALDVIDQAGAKTKTRCYKRPDVAKNLEKMMESCECEDELKKITKKYEEIMVGWASKLASKPPKVTDDDIYKVICQKAKIPLSELKQDEAKVFLNLEKSLNKLIIGQPEAVKKVSLSILRSKSGVRDENKPIGSFLLLGTTGVGKTFTAKMLAKSVFGGEENIIRVDMSEFSEKSSVSRLIGASPGYVGFEDGGYLTEAIRKSPYSVVLFDEVEKAHPEAYQILLQIMDEGELKDSNGKTANFKNSIILLTGNIGHASFNSQKTMGFGGKDDHPSFTESRNSVISEAKKFFKPEFLNRLDEVIIFKPLSKESNKKIARLELDKLSKRLEKQDIHIQYTPKVIDFLVEKGTSAKNGARFLKRVIQKNIEDKMSSAILSKKRGIGQRLKITKKNGQLVVNEV